ncbi:MAG: hypothetical protein ABSA45_04725 [Verrucomicrobiota bacterium]|jgi:hypothetical protein
MKIQTIGAVLAFSFLLTGCGKKNVPISTSPSPSNDQTNTASAALSVTQPALTAWQQGDKAAAVGSYVAANWSARPLFAAGSPLSLNDSQFKALSDAHRQAKSGELTAQLDSFKQLAAAVAQAGRDAASKGDTAQARMCFTSLKQCGTALDSPDCLIIVRLVGQGLKKRADTELAKLGQ